MIHLILGTKAQYIKTAPVLWELEARGIPFRLIDTGQHAGRSSQLREELKVRPPDLRMRTGGDLAQVKAGLSWMGGWIARGLAPPRLIRERLFAGQDGICLVHGDTASTWLGAWLAKRAGLKVAHLEAGLRSFHLLSPFPEEWCRRQTSRMAELLFAPSPWAAENLRRMRVKGRVILLGANTGLEAVRFSLKQPPQATPPWPAFALGLIHRMETLYSRRRLSFVVKALLRAAEESPLLFLLHEPTRRALTRAGLMGRLEAHPKVRCQSLVSHHAFIQLLQKARFVVTDGGSVQEESFYLNVPCLILRDRTERPEGLIPPGNVFLARWRWDRVEAFLKRPEDHHHRQELPAVNPSRQVVEALLSFLRF
ncbi:MAG: UDP-N-acetylglucosamine 2-epimerase [Candidatus Omnitrophica bacterium]|nr:UDP-N-acetylglucosamine 2-epimerase [Candidatus Omnitrophota bacterium]